MCIENFKKEKKKVIEINLSHITQETELLRTNRFFIYRFSNGALKTADSTI